MRAIEGNPQVEVTRMNPENCIDQNHFSSFYVTPSRGSATRIHVFVEELCDENNVVICWNIKQKVKNGCNLL